jgi:hypothetical protein
VAPLKAYTFSPAAGIPSVSCTVTETSSGTNNWEAWTFPMPDIPTDKIRIKTKRTMRDFGFLKNILPSREVAFLPIKLNNVRINVPATRRRLILIPKTEFVMEEFQYSREPRIRA